MVQYRPKDTEHRKVRLSVSTYIKKSNFRSLNQKVVQVGSPAEGREQDEDEYRMCRSDLRNVQFFFYFNIFYEQFQTYSRLTNLTLNSRVAHTWASISTSMPPHPLVPATRLLFHLTVNCRHACTPSPMTASTSSTRIQRLHSV